MEEMKKFILELIQKNWHKRIGLILINLLVIFSFGSFLYKYDIFFILNIFQIEVPNKITIFEVLILLLALLITTLIWILKVAPPKNRKDKVGIIIAIQTENENEKIRLKNDFIRNFQNRIKTVDKEQIFKIIEYPEYHSSQINSENVGKFLSRSQAHFIIYGLLNKRYHEGKENYFFNINVVVRHAPIPTDVSKQFSREIDLVAPRKVRFFLEEEFKGFEITSEWSAFATEYIIGVAAYLTGDFKFSSDLLLGLYYELQKLKTTLPAIKTLKEKNKFQLIESLYQFQRYKYIEYRKSNKRELLNEVSKTLDIIISIDPKNYSANISRAILFFLRDRDVDKAMKALVKVPYKRDDCWRYSEAFLYAYKGDMDKALSSYRKAFRGSVEPHVPEESEEFIHDILKLEPDKYQLWFCLGLINYFAKEDLILAKEDFNKFLGLGQEKEFQEQRRLANEYIKQIKL